MLLSLRLSLVYVLLFKKIEIWVLYLVILFSFLFAIGLPELVTETQAEYEALAIELATSPTKLKVIKDKLETNRLASQLFDTALFTKHIEAAYTKMYEKRK